MTKQHDHRLRLSTGAEPPEQIREQLVEEVRRKLKSGELDSAVALVETAVAILDGDAGRESR